MASTSDTAAFSFDQTDLTLIRFLQAHPRASYTTIAQMTGISDTTVRRRVQALFDAGLISSVVLPSLRMLGYTHSAVVMIRTEPGRSREVGEQLSTLNEVTYLSLTIARHSLACIVRTKSLRSLSELIQDKISGLPGVLEVEASVVSEVLRGWGEWRVPLEDESTGSLEISNSQDSVSPDTAAAPQE